jgi:hypothetical protein
VFRAVKAEGWSAFERCSDLSHVVYELEIDLSGRLWAACRLKGGGLGGLFLSRDGGVTWKRMASGSFTYALQTVTFSDEQFGIAGGSTGTVLRTGDGGQYWSPLSADIFHYHTILGSAATGPMHFWLITSAGSVFESTNAGGTWSEQSLTAYQLFDIDFHGRRGVIVGNSVAFYTADGGSSWNAVSVEPGGTQPELRSVAMLDSLRVVAGGPDGRLWMSEDGGENWAEIESGCATGADVCEIALSGENELWLSGRNIVSRIDLGQSPQPGCSSYELADTLFGENVRFRLEGGTEPERTILLTAHYDSRSGGSPYTCAPGADDNATGVAAVLESARALAGAETDYTIEFVLFDGEELGLLGSRAYAQNLDPGTNYEAVVNLDMLGYDKGADWSIEIAGRAEPVDSVIASFISATVETLGLVLQPEFLTSQRLTSDQMSFWHHDTIPSVLLIEGRYGDLSPYYHSCYDEADKVDYEYLTECTKLALGTVARLAGYRPAGQDTIPVEWFVLYQNSPNPFLSSTEISFALGRRSWLELSVYDASGRRVALLGKGVFEPDTYNVVWNGRNEYGRALSSGVYFLLLRADDFTSTRKMVLLR